MMWRWCNQNSFVGYWRIVIFIVGGVLVSVFGWDYFLLQKQMKSSEDTVVTLRNERLLLHQHLDELFTIQSMNIDTATAPTGTHRMFLESYRDFDAMVVRSGIHDDRFLSANLKFRLGRIHYLLGDYSAALNLAMESSESFEVLSNDEPDIESYWHVQYRAQLLAGSCARQLGKTGTETVLLTQAYRNLLRHERELDSEEMKLLDRLADDLGTATF